MEVGHGTLQAILDRWRNYQTENGEGQRPFEDKYSYEGRYNARANGHSYRYKTIDKGLRSKYNVLVPLTGRRFWFTPDIYRTVLYEIGQPIPSKSKISEVEYVDGKPVPYFEKRDSRTGKRFVNAAGVTVAIRRIAAEQSQSGRSGALNKPIGRISNALRAG